MQASARSRRLRQRIVKRRLLGQHRARRIGESIALLAAGKKLGLK